MWAFAEQPWTNELLSALTSDSLHNPRWFGERDKSTSLRCFASLLLTEYPLSRHFLALTLYQPNDEDYFYYIPLLITPTPLSGGQPHFLVSNSFFVYDAIPTQEYASAMIQFTRNNQTFSTNNGRFAFLADPGLDQYQINLKSTSSNSLLFAQQWLLLKNYRRIYPGINPEVSIGQALTKAGSKITPGIFGFFSFYHTQEYTLGVIQEDLMHSGTAWDLWGWALNTASVPIQDDLYPQAETLGDTIAELHRLMADFSKNEGSYQTLTMDEIDQRLPRITQSLESVPPELQKYSAAIIDKLSTIQDNLSNQSYLGDKFIIHGDLHLEQVVRNDNGWSVLDFEGEPVKPINERRVCDSPCKDVAAMLRSINYRVGSLKLLPQGTDIHEAELAQGFLKGYLQGCQDRNVAFIAEPEVFEQLLQFFQIERAVYECLYELKYRPDWLPIPLSGLQKLIQPSIEGVVI